jgi:hypothetical protein
VPSRARVWQPWATGIMLVGGKGLVPPQGRTWGFGEPTRRGSDSARMGAEANTTRIGRWRVLL